MKNEKTDNSSKEKIISRRRFMQASAAVAAFTIVPRHVLGQGMTAPSEKLNIATVGAGGMARSNIDNCNQENLVAFCDPDDDRAADTYKTYPDVKKYKDFRRMLDKEGKNIDAVIVACPDHVHAAASIMAMKMGKHVYCQKPLTHTVYEARKMTEVAKETGVVTQMGNQGHSSEQIRLEREWIQAGAVGDVHTVYAWTNRPVWQQGMARPTDTPSVRPGLDWDTWLGPAPVRPYHPMYLPFKWRGWYDFGTGALGDMGCHIIDHAFYALDLGLPSAVEAYASKRVIEDWKPFKSDEAYPDASVVRYEFPARGSRGPVTLTWFDGGLKPPRPPQMEPERTMPEGGVIFIGDKGAMLEGRIVPETKMREFKRPEKTIPRIEGSHEQNWINACKGAGPAPCANFSYAGPLTEAVLMGNVALRFEQRIEWDAKAFKVTNIPEANDMLHCQYRQGYTL